MACLGAWGAAAAAPLGGVAQEVERYDDIPADSLVVASIEVDDIITSQQFQAWPWEILSVLCREQLGFDLNEVESIDATVSMPSPSPEFGLSIRTKTPYDIAKLSDEIASPLETAPKDNQLKFRDMKEAPQIRISQKDPKRILIGTQGTLRRMLSQRIQTGGPIVPLVQSRKSLARIAVNLAKVRDLMNGFLEWNEGEMPPELISDVREVIQLAENAMLELTDNERSPLVLTIGTANANNTRQLEEAVQRLRSEGIQLTRAAVDEQVAEDPSLSDDMKRAIGSYSDRIEQLLQNQTMWSVVDDRIQLKTDTSMMVNYQTIGVLTGLLLPAVQAARTAARQMQSINDVRQIMLALLNYESTYRRFPGQAILSDDGKPLLSWRVAILPYLEQQELYNEFHLDEPWDSEHNIKLLERMPSVFMHRESNAPPGHTVYLAPVGEDTGWSEEGTRLREITDGTSNTIAVVQVDVSLAVPWTKPDDLDIQEHPGSSWMSAAGTVVAFFDCSARKFSSVIADEAIDALLTKNGGETVSPYELP